MSISILGLSCFDKYGNVYRHFYPCVMQTTKPKFSPSSAEEEELESGPQIARDLKVDPATVRRWRKEGMPHHLLGFGLVRYRMAEVLAWRAGRPSVPKALNGEARADQKSAIGRRASNRPTPQESELITVELARLCSSCQAVALETGQIRFRNWSSQSDQTIRPNTSVSSDSRMETSIG
jgi:hypothetical protein